MRGFEWRYLWNLCRDESLFTFTNYQISGDRNKLALDAEAQTLIVASGNTLNWLDMRTRRERQSTTIGTTPIARLSVAPGSAGPDRLPDG